MTKKAKKYDEDEEFEDSEDAESDITESDFEDPDEMEASGCDTKTIQRETEY